MIDGRGPHQADRLRHRGQGGRAAAHVRQAFADRGHARLHFTRAGEGQARRRPQRHLLAGRDSVRDVDRRRRPSQGPNPFAVMNDRLVNNPVPPRELNPEISPQLQEAIYRALEREPQDRYSTANEFALGPGASWTGDSGRPRGVARLEAAAHAMAEADSVLRRDGADSGGRLRTAAADCAPALRAAPGKLKHAPPMQPILHGGACFSLPAANVLKLPAGAAGGGRDA